MIWAEHGVTSSHKLDAEKEWSMAGKTNIQVRGIYGGLPTPLMAKYGSLSSAGFNAVWVGSGTLTAELVQQLRSENAFAFAEFNTMHHREYLEEYPDAQPIGSDGGICPPPDGWQGACPTHPGYRKNRMDAFRRALADFEIDGIWLDYHHSLASWEQAEPNLPDTCFCARCLFLFENATGLTLPKAPAREISDFLLGPVRARWTSWRCAVFTDWVREFQRIRDEVRPRALLGTFHCPWTDLERNGALRNKLAIDLSAQREHIDVFSPMPYHARFGHGNDIAWISRQISWLGEFLHITGTETADGSTADDAEGVALKRIWPIVQLSDWGEAVPLADVVPVLTAGTKLPATGITVFNWGSLQNQPEKAQALSEYFRAA